MTPSTELSSSDPCWLTREQSMSDEPPTPPTSLSTEVANALNDLPPEHLRDIARYAEKLAEHKEREDRLEEESNEDESEDGQTSFRRCPVESHDHDQGRSTTTAITTGSGEKATKSARSTRAQSTQTSSRPLFRKNRTAMSTDSVKPGFSAHYARFDQVNTSITGCVSVRDDRRRRHQPTLVGCQ